MLLAWGGKENQFMKRTASLLGALLFFSSQAATAATWSIIGFATEPQNVDEIAAAAEALMKSETGKSFPGRLFFQVNLADGDNPATHAFVPVYETAADAENFRAKLQQDPAWTAFQGAMNGLTQPVSNVMYRTIERWGDVSDDDVVWRVHAFAVEDPAAFRATIDKFMGSKTGKKFPGQVFLSSVVAGGLTQVSHVISVGYASEADVEAWEKKIQGSDDWVNYLEESQKTGEYLGNSMIRTLKTWGASLDEVTK
jgi:hypothetical protein